MPPLPAELYIPAFGALLAALAWLSRNGTRVTEALWTRNQVISDREFDRAERLVTALDASTAATRELRQVFEELREDGVANRHVLDQLLAIAQGRNPGRAERGGGSTR